jgi:hypothetical protein
MKERALYRGVNICNVVAPTLRVWKIQGLIRGHQGPSCITSCCTRARALQDFGEKRVQSRNKKILQIQISNINIVLNYSCILNTPGWTVKIGLKRSKTSLYAHFLAAIPSNQTLATPGNNPGGVSTPASKVLFSVGLEFRSLILRP